MDRQEILNLKSDINNNIDSELSELIKHAYNQCLSIVINHYENFVVASKFLPKKLRFPIAAIYAFARYADDIADEGKEDKASRINRLDNLYNQVNQFPNLLILKKDLINNNNSKKINHDEKLVKGILLALQDSVIKFNLSKQLLLDLLIAFKQDVIKSRYNNFSEILYYCKHSANPIGRLLLEITGNNTEYNNKLSDNICTGLQLINFMQDIHSDLTVRDRCYMPMEEMDKLGINISDFYKKNINNKINQFISEQLVRIKKIYYSGKNLGKILPGLFGFEIKMIILGGDKIIKKLEFRNDPYYRPVISRLDKLDICFKALIGGDL